MRGFMDYVHSAFYEATGWSPDNSYAALNATSDALLDFQTPRGLRLTLSSLASANFATSYQLGSVGVVDGSISYLFSSVPLRAHLTPRSEDVSLPELLRSYRPLRPLSGGREDGEGGGAASSLPSLFYGRLYLPQSRLEALAVKRMAPALQLQLSAVSAEHLRDGGTMLGLAQYDVGRYAVEGVASSDGGLLGVRGVYNFGGDAKGPWRGGTSRTNGNGNDNNRRDQSKTSNQNSQSKTSTPDEKDNQRDQGKTSRPDNTSNHNSRRDQGKTSRPDNPSNHNSRRDQGKTSRPDNPSNHNSQRNQGKPSRPEENTANGCPAERERIYGRLSTGAEMYYGTLNKSGGISLGGRFATLPAHDGTPLSATLTLNPLMGNIAASYAVVAGKHCSLASRLEFNVFSYESAWAVGMELWRKPLRRLSVEEETVPPLWRPARERSFQAKLEWRLDGSRLEARQEPEPEPGSVAPPPLPTRRPEPDKMLSLCETEARGEEYAGVLKARLDQNLRIGILWEGRVKSLLFSLGSGIDLKRLDKPFRTLGLEMQFSS